MGKEAKKTKPPRKKPSRSPPPPKERPPWWRFVRYCLVLLLAGGAALAWLSVLTFNPGDPSPSNNVWPPQPVRNAGGVAGAYLAYALLYWLGDGAYMLLGFATIASAFMLLGGRIADWPWRLVGLALMVTATSSSGRGHRRRSSTAAAYWAWPAGSSCWGPSRTPDRGWSCWWSSACR